MARFLLALALTALLGSVAHSQDKDIFFEVPDRTKLVEHEKIVREALPKEPAESPLTPELQKSLEFVVHYHVFKLAPADVKLAQTLRDVDKAMSAAVEITEAWIRNVFPPLERKDLVKNPPLQQAFVKTMLKDLERVLQNAQQFPIVRVNAAKLLARLAQQSGAEEVADLLVKVLADTQQIDGARYFACQGLKDLLKRAPRNTPAIKDAKRRGEVVAALVAFIERKPPFTPNTAYEEEGLRVLRREGIRALAQTYVAIVPGTANGHGALCLCRVVGGDVLLVPPPRLDEQLEAAIGLAHLTVDEQKEYQPGYAAWHIGSFVAHLGLAFKDRKPTSREPWKVHAARLDEVLKEMAKTLSDPTVSSVQNLSAPILNAILGNINPTTDQLRGWVQSNQPPQRSVYKSDAKSVVTPRQAKME